MQPLIFFGKKLHMQGDVIEEIFKRFNDKLND